MNEMDATTIRAQLSAVGVGKVGLRTPEVKELAKILHPEENIGGVVYGRHNSGLAWLVATDKRIIFLNKKPLFSTMDELTYDVVSGVKSSRAGIFNTVVLHTRVSDYVMRFVNTKCTHIFIKYIEARRLETGKYNVATGRHVEEKKQLPQIDLGNVEALSFLKSHDLGVLSTVDRTGNVAGAVVYYMVDQDNLIYILTRSATNKDRNIHVHSQIALTICEADTQETVQLSGLAEIETNQKMKNTVFSQMTKPRLYGGQSLSPPVTKLQEGIFTVIRISPTDIAYFNYSKT